MKKQSIKELRVKKDNFFLKKRRKILVNEKKLEMQKLNLKLAMAKKNIVKLNKAKNKLESLNNSLNERTSYLYKNIPLLINTLKKLRKEKIIIQKKKTHLIKLVSTINNSVRKEGGKIRELGKDMKKPTQNQKKVKK